MSNIEKVDESSRLTKAEIALIVAIVVGLLSLFVYVGYLALSPKERPENLAFDAVKYLRGIKGGEISQPLSEMLESGSGSFIDSQQHPILGKLAPDFSCRGADGQEYTLRELTDKGPVVLVFYLGYFCDHCVAQLFGLAEDSEYFREFDTRIVALSPDTPEHTREMFERYGEFPFPVLSDPNAEVAKQYEVTDADQPEFPMHATMVIDSKRVVRWIFVGHTPFVRNETLLYELSKIQGTDENETEN